MIFLLLSSEIVFKIVIEDLFSWFDYGFEHLNYIKNLVLFPFTFRVKEGILKYYSNYAAFSRNYRIAVNNSG